ncbi:MAG: DNA primase [Micromonosporaceae bacterium]|nr:DNA primase [Micromonosporaceae bacterium]
MAGRIRDADIALVRERTAIAEVISEHVTLKPAGPGNLKGLCPFHDEKTPSFNVSTARNVYYCHGCGNGGDAISFVMQVEHFTFAEAVERLAGKVGVTLRYEEGSGGPAQERKPGLRQRLHAAHKDALHFYAEQLGRPEARIARDFLASRGFHKAAAEVYSCGFALDSWDALTKHLRAKGYTAEELVAGGLSKQARSGSLIDRFRRRLMWPIKELSGEVIGFGARKLFDDDDGPKYLNTPETPIYKKSTVLYGIEIAKREIAKQGRAVVVEGYTDVMACHLADVPTAVASCGTSFGGEHIGVLRRLLMDADEFKGEIIFTFDGDAAGQKAALRAFADDQRFVAQTFIAVSPDNMDPCDLRLAKGDAAVRDLVARREPMIAFALRSALFRYDLDTAEGRVAALRYTAPLVAKIKDRALRPEYARKLAGDLGMEIEPVVRAVSQAMSRGGATDRGAMGRGGGPRRDEPSTGEGRPAPSPDSPQSVVEREALKLAIQQPVLAGPLFDAVDATPYLHPVHAAVRQAIADSGGAASATAGADWVERIRAASVDLAAQALVGELSVEPLRYDAEVDPRYVTVTLARLQLPAVNRRIGELKSRVQRINPVEHKDEYLTLAGELFSLEQQARGLKEQALGAL